MTIFPTGYATATNVSSTDLVLVSVAGTVRAVAPRDLVNASTTINTQTGTAYTLVLTDAGKIVETNNAAANTVTIPPNSSVAFPIGTQIEVVQYGAGQTTIVAGSGVTIQKPYTLVLAIRYARVTFYKRATDEWVLSGVTT